MPDRAGSLDRRLIARVQAARWFVAVAVAIGLASTAAVVAQAVLLASVITGAVQHHQTLAALTPQLLGLAGAFLARALLAWIGAVAAEHSAAAVAAELRARLVHEALDLGPAWLAGERAGELSLTATRGIQSLQIYFGRYLPQAVLAAVAPLAILVWVGWADWPSLLILLGLLLAVPPAMVHFGRGARRHAERQWRTLSSLASRFLELVEGLPTLRAFGQEGRGREEVAHATERLRRTTLGTLRVAFLSALALDLLAGLGTGLVAMVLGLRLLAGDVALGTGLAVLLVSPEVFLPVRRAGAEFHASAEGQAAAERVLDILDRTGPAGAAPGAPATPVGATGAQPAGPVNAAPGGPAVSATPVGATGAQPTGPAGAAPGPPAAPVPAPSTAGEGRALEADGHRRGPGDGHPPCPIGITLRQVTVTFPDRPDPVIERLDLAIDPGERVVLTGPSGSGKSTVLHLLLGFVPADAGSLWAGDAELTAARMEEWRRWISWVPQRPHLFRGTLADNLLGPIGATTAPLPTAPAPPASASWPFDSGERAATLDAIGLGDHAATLDAPSPADHAATLDAIGLGDLVRRLPDGPATPLGAGGTSLSAGERQLVALGRAVVREAPVVLLDEPTAHLDPEAARRVVHGLAPWLAGRTVLVASHDPALQIWAERAVPLGLPHRPPRHEVLQ